MSRNWRSGMIALSASFSPVREQTPTRSDRTASGIADPTAQHHSGQAANTP